MINVTINGIAVKVPEGTTVLEAARKAQIKIPSLCYSKDLVPWGSCGLCIVHLENNNRMMRACCTMMTEGMSVITHDAGIIKARKAVLELILSNHPQDCLTCIRNGACELQNIAAELGMRQISFKHYTANKPKDDTNKAIVFDRLKCISCGRCVEVCQNVQKVYAIEHQGRGENTIIAPAALTVLEDSPCVRCGQCAAHCPVGAIYETPLKMDILNVLADPAIVSTVQVAPSVRVALGEEFGYTHGELTTKKMYAVLRRIGFQYVFDTNFGADLTIMEEATEFLANFQNKNYTFPQFTSCCPAWVDLAEKRYHTLVPHLSTAKSPMQMLGTIIKTYWAQKMGIQAQHIFSAAVMPCTAKKYECERNEDMNASGYQDVDAVLTTRELARLIRQAGIDFDLLEEQEADNPLGVYSGAGTIFGASGGVMEAALRTAHFYLTGKELENLDFMPARGLDGIKEAKVIIDGTEIRIAIVHQLGNLPDFLEKITAAITEKREPPYHFVEVMACRGGCVGGGGQPYGCDDGVRSLRGKGLYTDDEQSQMRTSHSNPYIKQLYSEYLGNPNTGKAHHLLHTHYIERSLYK